jgi:hypothetical protein
MSALPISDAAGSSLSLQRAARFPNLRALAWDGDILYASRGYTLLRARIPPEPVSPERTSLHKFSWETVAEFPAPLWRQCSSRSKLSARFARDGFHALTISSSGSIIAAVPGAIVTLAPGEKKFRTTHAITRGTRPLHIAVTPEGTIFWGEYFDNPSRDEVHIYASYDSGTTWNVAYTFPRGAIRHVHNIVYDKWGKCLWVLTGDYGDECRILRASCDFRNVDVVLKGNQQARAVALIPTESGLYFSSDTPLENNTVYCLDRNGALSALASISSSSVYGCRVGQNIFFSTMIEPSEHNLDRHVRIYGRADGHNWQSLLAWKKDRWPMRFFQYGNAFLPDGENTTSCLALTTIAVESDDLVTSIYSIHR